MVRYTPAMKKSEFIVACCGNVISSISKSSIFVEGMLFKKFENKTPSKITRYMVCCTAKRFKFCGKVSNTNFHVTVQVAILSDSLVCHLVVVKKISKIKDMHAEVWQTSVYFP